MAKQHAPLLRAENRVLPLLLFIATPSILLAARPKARHSLQGHARILTSNADSGQVHYQVL